MGKAYRQQPADSLQLTELPHFPQPRAREAIIEGRLRALTRFLERFGQAVYSALLSERESTREAVEELHKKESTLCWIVRVAKHSEGAVRERLWRDIEKGVTDLEKLAESFGTSSKVLPFPVSAALPSKAAKVVHIR